MPTLTLDVTADAAAAAASLGSVGDAAKDMATDVQTAAATADTAAGSMDGLAGSADNLDSKASQATGAFGALAGGLEAAGFDGAAAGLQGVAVATDFASGAGGLFNLVLESQAAQFIIQKARMAASVVATGAQATATGAATAAQWLWNAAMSANPIGLLIAGLALVTGGLILAYNKVGPFRDVVDAAMGAATDAIGFVVDAVGDLIGWIGDLSGSKVWDGLSSVIDIYLTPLQLAVGAVSTALEAAVGWVQNLIEWIGKIDIPDLPFGNPFNRSGFVPNGGFDPTQGPSPFGLPLAGDTPLVIQLTVEPPGDKDDATKKMVEAMREYFARQGQTLSLTTAR